MSRKILAPFSLFLLVVVGFQAAFAQELSRSTESALDSLKKMADAPRRHNYSGIFIYYADDHIETSRIFHKTGPAGEFEKIEVLDGSPRIVFRDNEEIQCYLLESKRIFTEKRWLRKFFPDLLPLPLDNVDENYAIRELGSEKIAGRECQVLALIPKDSLRYGQKFWVDAETGVPVKAAVVNGNQIIEQFAFAQLEIGGEIDPSQLKPDQTLITDGWKTTNLLTSILNEDELHWQINSLPAGFRKLIEMKRNLAEKTGLVDHIALSDGVATISVFIELISKDEPSPIPGFFTGRGAINIYVRALDSHKITTIGEVPLETIKLIGDSVVKKN